MFDPPSQIGMVIQYHHKWNKIQVLPTAISVNSLTTVITAAKLQLHPLKSVSITPLYNIFIYLKIFYDYVIGTERSFGVEYL